ncbi:MAG: hypothetical protein ABFD92_07115 [Planctomycetaceae bacterium]|nr:hypothetical protein [Planctomycetaceae bacterium]
MGMLHSPDGKRKCPSATAHARLDEAMRLWRRAAVAYFDPPEFRTFLNASIQALRNVTWVLQKQKKEIPQFDDWYGAWRERLANDPIMTWLVDARNQIVKEGDLITKSTVRIAVVACYFEPTSLEMEADPLASVDEIIGALDLRQVPQEVREDGFVRIERKWIAEDLPAFELLDALVHACGVLSELLHDADRNILRLDRDSSESGQSGDIGNLPAYMRGEPEFRTICVRLSNGDRIAVTRRVAFSEMGQEVMKAQYGGFPIISLEQMGSGNLRKTSEWLFECAREIFLVDGYHVPIVFLLLPDRGMLSICLKLDEQIEKYLVWRAIAGDVERTGAEAIIAIGEMWWAPYDAKYPHRQAGQSSERREMLALYALSRDDEAISLKCDIIRSNEGVTLEEVAEENQVSPNFLEPVKRVWFKKKEALRPKKMLPDLVEGIIRSIQVRNIDLDMVPSDTVAHLLERSASKHRFDGAAMQGRPPVLLFRIADGADAAAIEEMCQPSIPVCPIGLLVWPWEARFGGLLTVTVMGKIPSLPRPGPGPMPLAGPHPRVCLRPDDPAFDSLKAGAFIGVFVYDRRPIGAIEAVFPSGGAQKSPLHQALIALSSHSMILKDPIASYWEVLDALTTYKEHLNPEDQLSLGWIREYTRWAVGFHSYLECVDKELSDVNIQASGLSEGILNILISLRDGGFRPEPLLESFAKLEARGPKILFRACAQATEELGKWAKQANHIERTHVANLPFFALDLYLLSSTRTSAGLVLPWLRSDSSLSSLKLTPSEFPKACPPEEYWRRIGTGLRLNLGMCVGAADAPASLQSDESWQALGCADGIAVTEDESYQMLNELAERKDLQRLDGTKMTVDLGDFKRMDVTAINADLYCVLRNKCNEFIYMCIEPRNQFCSLIAPTGAARNSHTNSALTKIKLEATRAVLAFLR